MFHSLYRNGTPRSDPRQRHSGNRAAISLFAACLLLALAATPANVQSRTGHEHKRDARREIQALEVRWKQAQLAGDVATMETLLADDYFGISISGQLNDKTQQLERLRSRQFVLTSIELSDVRIKLLGPVAIVTSLARIEGTDTGTSIKGTYRYTRVYKRNPDGSWKITNFEVTQVPRS